jgi:hypothetical protein
MSKDDLDLPHGDEFDPDSPAAAMFRLQQRLRGIHPQAAWIVTAYAALELEVDQALRLFLTRPDKLPRLGLEKQLDVLRALTEDAWLDLVLDTIGAYGAIRNAVAHGDDASTISKAIAKLAEKSNRIGMPITSDTNFGSFAMGLAAALQVGVESLPYPKTSAQ